MELSFRDLRKRDVINVSDGACLGRIIDVVLDFPKGNLTAIVVPGRRGRGIFGFFNKTDIVISEKKIVKIGNDVILVELKYGGGYIPNDNKKPHAPSCQPPCPPPCPPSCPPYPPKPHQNGYGEPSFPPYPFVESDNDEY